MVLLLKGGRGRHRREGGNGGKRTEEEGIFHRAVTCDLAHRPRSFADEISEAYLVWLIRTAGRAPGGRKRGRDSTSTRDTGSTALASGTGLRDFRLARLSTERGVRGTSLVDLRRRGVSFRRRMGGEEPFFFDFPPFFPCLVSWASLMAPSAARGEEMMSTMGISPRTLPIFALDFSTLLRCSGWSLARGPRLRAPWAMYSAVLLNILEVCIRKKING